MRLGDGDVSWKEKNNMNENSEGKAGVRVPLRGNLMGQSKTAGNPSKCASWGAPYFLQYR